MTREWPRYVLATIAVLILFIVSAMAARACLQEEDEGPGPEIQNLNWEVFTPGDGFGRVATGCIDGVRVFIADHDQVGYGISTEQGCNE